MRAHGIGGTVLGGWGVLAEEEVVDRHAVTPRVVPEAQREAVKQADDGQSRDRAILQPAH